MQSTTLTKGNALWAFLGGITVSMLAVAAGLWYFNQALSAGFETYLRQNVIGSSGKVKFQKAGIGLLRHRLYVDGLEFNGVSAEGVQWTSKIDEVSLQVPLTSLGSGKLDGSQVVIHSPSWDVIFSTSNFADQAPAESQNSANPALAWLKQIPFGGFTLSDGTIHLEYAGGGQPIDVKNIFITAHRDPADPSNTVINMESRLTSDSRASLAANAKLYELAPHTGFDGEIRLNDFPIAALGNFFPPDPDVAYKDGRLNINTQFNCKNDWLTASHLVEIKNFKVEVSPKKDELLGVSTKYLQELFSIDHLSFVLPMNGSLEDPHIGVSSSVQQILLKVLEAKFKDHDKAEKWAKWGGDHFGKKIDRVIKEWLQEKRKSGR